MNASKCEVSLPVFREVMLRLSLLSIALAAGPGVQAATTSGPLLVTATVTASCLVGASSLAFPSATSAAIAAGNVDAVGNVVVNCTTGSAYTVTLDAGTGTGATLPSRKMTSGALLLSYTVYTTAARTTVWGDGTGSTTTVSGTGSGADQSISAYGRIFAGQVVAAASYADTVNVTVSY
ncbi:MAG: spore coat U domain-containing protein [Burkholderiaceae bacterium]|nr:spore coat U domain-containing protein [Burkholderiaceae bacterium]